MLNTQFSIKSPASVQWSRAEGCQFSRGQEIIWCSCCGTYISFSTSMQWNIHNRCILVAVGCRVNEYICACPYQSSYFESAVIMIRNGHQCIPINNRSHDRMSSLREYLSCDSSCLGRHPNPQSWFQNKVIVADPDNGSAGIKVKPESADHLVWSRQYHVPSLEWSRYDRCSKALMDKKHCRSPLSCWCPRQFDFVDPAIQSKSGSQ